jgi:C_GCAxxG_C_C family probable redox protein
MNNSYQKGKAAFASGLYCAESVVMVIAEEEGIHSELLPGIATGFCSGLARTCNMCGAVTGGILALNLVFGRHSIEDSVEANYTAVQTLLQNFEEAFGSLNCQELLGCDLGNQAGQQTFRENHLHLRCREYTGKATEFARNIINSNLSEVRNRAR